MNCHFCNNTIPKVPGRLQRCRAHPKATVIHMLDVWNPPCDEPFSITIRLPNKLDIMWKPSTKEFQVWDNNKLLLELDKFPEQLTPENAAEEILFYLTFA